VLFDIGDEVAEDAVVGLDEFTMDWFSEEKLGVEWETLGGNVTCPCSLLRLGCRRIVRFPAFQSRNHWASLRQSIPGRVCLLI
jgi:hypothetical protein